jgi:hypothetical protein
VFATPTVLQDTRTVLFWTPLDQAAPGLDIDERTFSFGAVVADFDFQIDFFDCGRAIEFDRILALVLVGDDVAEAIDAALGKLWEIGFGPLGKFDRPGFVTEETHLGNRVTAGFPEVSDLSGDIDPLFSFINLFEVDLLIAILTADFVTVNITIREIGTHHTPASFVKWNSVVIDKRSEALLDILEGSAD